MGGNIFAVLCWMLAIANMNTSTTFIPKQLNVLLTLNKDEQEKASVRKEEMGQLVLQIFQRETLRDCHVVLLGGPDSDTISYIVR